MCEPGRSLNHLSKHVVDAAQNVLCPLLTLCGQKRYYMGSYEDIMPVLWLKLFNTDCSRKNRNDPQTLGLHSSRIILADKTFPKLFFSSCVSQTQSLATSLVPSACPSTPSCPHQATSCRGTNSRLYSNGPVLTSVDLLASPAAQR